jgi:hypothetical protein
MSSFGADEGQAEACVTSVDPPAAACFAAFQRLADSTDFVQVAVILFYTLWVLEIRYRGSLGLLFLVIVLLGIVGINMGILALAFAREAFQVIQFIPLAIFPPDTPRRYILGGNRSAGVPEAVCLCHAAVLWQ